MRLRGSLLLLQCCLLSIFALSTAEDDVETFVNTKGGTASQFDLSHGNLLPLVSVPWGFSGFSPQSQANTDHGGFWFSSYDSSFYGVRYTHQPSPWINDWGAFLITPSLVDPAKNYSGQSSGYESDPEDWKPYLWRASLLSSGSATGFTTIAVSPSTHGGIFEFDFPQSPRTRRVAVDLGTLINPISFPMGLDDYGEITVVSATSSGAEIRGYTRQHSSRLANASSFHLFFSITVDTSVSRFHRWGCNTTGILSEDRACRIWIDFDGDSAGASKITLRLGTSLISHSQARLNRERELPNSLDFSDVVDRARLEWRKTLSRLTLNSSPSNAISPENKTIFYTNVYRSSLYPRFLSEIDESGKEWHWSPFVTFGQSVLPGPMVTDSGFWDAYRTLYPQLSLTAPDVLGRMVAGWVNAAKENGGWLPKWASPGPRDSMVGTMGDLVLADAIVKGISGFDREAAYTAIHRDAFVPPPPGVNRGRIGLEAYTSLGFIPTPAPNGAKEEVSRTLNYVLADYSIAQAAKALGKQADYEALAGRSTWYAHLFDESTGFFRGRTNASQWTTPFDEFRWGSPYTEAGPWQYRFYAPHDAAGLAKLYNGTEVLCQKLDEAQTMPSTFHIGSYPSEIHEMTEMGLNCWGQYEHNNQPVHHVLWMFIAAAEQARARGEEQSVIDTCLERGHFWLTKAVRDLYKSGDDMFCGDEDNGELSSWYLMSALGMYSLAPGSTELHLGIPFFDDMTIRLPNDKSLRIQRKDGTGARRIEFNGKELPGLTIEYQELMTEGGQLVFSFE